MTEVKAAEGAPRSRWRWLGWGVNVVGFLSVVGILFYFAVPQIREKVAIVKPITFVGHSDDAAYAIMGDSLVNGRRLDVNYVSYFFIPYSPEVTRREDHWPPFMGFAIAPCFYIWGKAAWVAKLPAIAFGSIGLPLTAALLAYALSRRGYAAIVAGLLMMAHPFMYEQSLRTLSDVSTAMLVAGFAGSLLLADRWKWMYLAAGVFAGMAYYSKGSEILLVGMYPAMAVVAFGWRTLKSGWMWGGVLTMVLVMAPFWYSNYKLFGNPVHSTQNYISGFFSFEDWEHAAYFPYWGNNLPKTSDRWNKYGTGYWRSSAANMRVLGEVTATGMGGGAEVWRDFGGWGYRVRDFLDGEWARSYGPEWMAHLFGWVVQGDPANGAAVIRREDLEKGWERPARKVGSWRYPAWELGAAGAGLLVLWMLVAGVGAGYVWMQRVVGKWSGKGAGVFVVKDHAGDRLLIGPVMAVGFLFAVQFVFLAYFWDVETRFALMFLPLLAGLGCTAGAHFLERPVVAVLAGIRGVLRRQFGGTTPRRWVRVMDAVVPYWHVVLTIGFAAGLLMYAKPLQARYAAWLDGNMSRSGYPFEDEARYPVIGKWVDKTMPEAVIMSRNPWEIAFYAPRSKGVAFPNPDGNGKEAAEQIFAIARYYHVKYMLNDETRPCLIPYMLGREPGLKRVRGLPGPAFFEIDWTKVPANWTVEDAFGKGKAEKK